MAAELFTEEVKTIIWMARRSEAYKAKLYSEIERIMLEKLENNGGDVVSGGANGVNFQRSPAQIAYENKIRMAITHIEAGTNPTSKSYVRVIQ